MPILMASTIFVSIPLAARLVTGVLGTHFEQERCAASGPFHVRHEELLATAGSRNAIALQVSSSRVPR